MIMTCTKSTLFNRGRGLLFLDKLEVAELVNCGSSFAKIDGVFVYKSYLHTYSVWVKQSL